MRRASGTIAHRVAMLAWVLALLCWATLPVQAQETAQRRDRSPRIEVGGHIGSFAVMAGDGFAILSAGPRVTVNITSHDAVELATDAFLAPTEGSGLYGLWLVQYKRVLRDGGAGRTAVFVTGGVGSGLFYDRVAEYRYRRPDGAVIVYPAHTRAGVGEPVIVGGGFGVERIVARYAAVRAEVQVVTAGLPVCCVRGAIGISIPIGGYRAF